MQKLVDLRALFFVGSHQKPVHYIRRHFLKNVYRIVQIHLFHNLFQLGICQGIDQDLPHITVHVGECFRRLFFRQQTKHHDHMLLVKFFQNIRQIYGIHIIFQLFLQLFILPVFKHIQNTFLCQLFPHFVILFTHKCIPPFRLIASQVFL